MSHVHVTVNSARANGRENVRSDEPKVAHCRVHLKIAALAYDASRHGTDACAEFTRDAMIVLCGAAVRYYATLTKRSDEPPAAMHLDNVQARNLALAALAYARGRHGSDMHLDFTRSMIGVLCDGAIRFGELAYGARGRSDEGPTCVEDPVFKIEAGARR